MATGGGRLCASRPAMVVIDLSRVPMIGSLGMGMHLNLRKSLDRHGGRVKFAGLQPLVADAFKRTKLLEVFDVHDSTDAALATRA